MTMYYEPANLMPNAANSMMSSQSAANCMLTMGETSERVAERFGVSRARQDAFAVESHRKAFHAQTHGYFEGEIVPVSVKKPDGSVVLVKADDGVRGDTSFEALSKLKASFREGGTTTAGNASQVSDGAAAVLLMKRSTAEALRLPIEGKFVGFTAVGVPPDIMGVGPAYAIPKVLQLASIRKEDIDIYEINEAFASQAVYCVDKLGIDGRRVNPVGGAIAFGHPLGCTGARMVATMLNQLRRRNERLGVISMCVGTGMGAAGIIEREH
jgi:acetyl-CoA acyltransferase 1